MSKIPKNLIIMSVAAQLKEIAVQLFNEHAKPYSLARSDSTAVGSLRRLDGGKPACHSKRILKAECLRSKYKAKSDRFALDGRPAADFAANLEISIFSATIIESDAIASH